MPSVASLPSVAFLAEPLSLPFQLRIPADTRTGGMGSVSSREHEIRGIARIEDGSLVLEWSGTTKVSEINGFAADVRSEPFPPGRGVLPLAAIRSIRRRGWWRRPRVELQVSELDLFAGVPGASGPTLSLDITRADVPTAGQLVVVVRATCRSVPGRALSGPT
jgi:hypothetical protein